MLSAKISERVSYIGVNDRRTSRFEAMWPLPYGVSYNSYLVDGGDRVAIIDGVEVSRGLQQIAEIHRLLGDRRPDYLIINHMEPDHSGAIRLLRSEWPDIEIVASQQALKMIEGYYGVVERTRAVKDGDALTLGENTTLRFHLTPMVHWPETMMTYLEEEETLFTGDAFGCFGALNGAVLDRDMDYARYMPEMVRYYSNIVGKYGMFVQRALKKLDGVKLSTLCTTHGPVWQENLQGVVELYDRLSRYEAMDDGVTIIYGSMYGNMEQLAEAAAEGLSSAGVRRIEMFNASTAEMSDILAAVFRHKGLVVAAPTYSDSLFPPVANALRAITLRGVKDRKVAVLGTCTWAERASGIMTKLLEDGGLSVYDKPFVIKHSPSEEDLEGCRAMMAAYASEIMK
ncbi:MAG: FprA family A-type flavoprotein [Muribaculaceae bacterium]|nr:FprA family A-type flavoprotein [Muribaculaceae bacterium]